MRRWASSTSQGVWPRDVEGAPPAIAPNSVEGEEGRSGHGARGRQAGHGVLRAPPASQTWKWVPGALQGRGQAERPVPRAPRTAAAILNCRAEATPGLPLATLATQWAEVWEGSGSPVPVPVAGVLGTGPFLLALHFGFPAPGSGQGPQSLVPRGPGSPVKARPAWSHQKGCSEDVAG